MVIAFSKPKDGSSNPTLTITRDDGSEIWQASSTFFVAHDLTHFAVEATLGIQSAFYGLICGGWSFEEFAEREPDSRKIRPLPDEAVLVEILVGFLDVQRAQTDLDPDQLKSLFTDDAKTRALTPFPLTIEALVAIILRRDELIQNWRSIPSGGTLSLEFP